MLGGNARLFNLLTMNFLLVSLLHSSNFVTISVKRFS